MFRIYRCIIIIAVISAANLLLASGTSDAQEVDPPTPIHTATPVPTSIPDTETRISGPPTQTAESGDSLGTSAEAIPNPEPAGEPDDSAAAIPTPEPGSDEASPAESNKQFDLNAYPVEAKVPAKQKWRTFKEAVRGLLVWDFFDGRLTIRASARVQVDGTLARADSLLGQVTGPLGDSLRLRRLEAVAQGTIDHHLRYNISFNFGADPGFSNLFVEGREHGLKVFGYRIGQFRAGSFQAPFSFERVMSSYYTGFLERSLPVWTFTPGVNWYLNATSAVKFNYIYSNV